MTSATTEDFFDDAVREGAPSFKFGTLGDFVKGEVVDQYMIDATDFATGEVLKDRKTGQTIKQLVIVLQTDLRNWDKVAKIPLTDPKDKSSAKPASADDGKRAIYVRKFTNIHAAVGRAVLEGTGQKGGVRNGGTLGVQFFDTEDTGKGNPLKKYRATYAAPAAGSGDFFESAPAAVPTPKVEDPFAAKAPAPAAGDPWANSTKQVDEPPF